MALKEQKQQEEFKQELADSIAKHNETVEQMKKVAVSSTMPTDKDREQEMGRLKHQEDLQKYNEIKDAIYG